MHARGRTLQVVAVMTSLVATACGTRLANSAFAPANANAALTPAAQGGNAVGGGQGPGSTPGSPSGIVGSGAGTSNSLPASGTPTAGNATASGPTSNQSSTPVAPNHSTQANFVSDVGVTADSITIGNVTGVNGFLGPTAFGPTLWGLQAFVAATNAKGGIGGRKLILDTCDDGQDGSKNLACVEQLVGQQHVFALLANNSLTTAPSAHYEFTQGVPDIGLPLNNGYYKYPNMFTIYGTDYPRDGTQVGDHGTQWQPTGVFRYYKRVVGVTKAAYFFYSEASSQQAAYSEEQEATIEGIQTVYESGGHQGENIEAPNFDADVLAMKSKGADATFDAVDVAGNEKICASMDRYGVKVKARGTTIENWSQQVGTPAWSSPCRNSLYASGSSVPYSDTQMPIIAEFRHDYDTYSPGKLLHQWAVDGYGHGLVFEDAVNAMGANVTRKGFISWLDSIPQPPPIGNGNYTAHGIFAPFSWQNHPHPDNNTNCNSFAQWQDSAGTFVDRSPGGQFTCYVVSEVSSQFTPDGS